MSKLNLTKWGATVSDKTSRWLDCAALLALLLILPGYGVSATLPKATQAMLQELKLDPSILAAIDKDLEVPREWIENAKKEKRLRVMHSSDAADQQRDLFAPFKERYPFITLEYSDSTRDDRIKIISAYGQGRIVLDVLTNISSLYPTLRKMNALENLQPIPGVKRLPAIAKDEDGLSIGLYSVYRCMGYNTRLLRKEDLPRKWEDVLTNSKLRGGNLALGNRPEQWALNLWKAKGETWTKNFLTRLFGEIKPQLRKEGLNALAQLLAPGEFSAVIPANNGRIHEVASEGAPVGFTCPEPAPLGMSRGGILKGTPHVNSAKLLVNWFSSKEGQISWYFARGFTPIHADLLRPELVPFADEVLGKEVSLVDEEFYMGAAPKLNELWNGLWMKRGR
jgi:iron(III) transport system substrate-binding protein